MARTSLPAEVVSAASGTSYAPFWACDLLFDTPNELYFWNGLGQIENAGKTYIGAGDLLDISELRESSDIAAYGATLTLSGIPTDKISLALNEPYQGRVCNVYFGVLRYNSSSAPWILNDGFWRDQKVWADDQEWNDANVYLALSKVFSGNMDQMNVSMGPETSTITLSVESRLVDLNRARSRRYTDADQRSRYANDRAFEFVTRIQEEKLEWEAT